MGVRLPKANLNAKQLQATLVVYAQNIHTKLTANADFPSADFPVTLVVLQGYIDRYQAALVNAVKGSKNQTAVKSQEKANLIALLRSFMNYVNQTVYNFYVLAGSKITIAQIEALILSTGFDLSKTPGAINDTTGLLVPIIKKAQSNQPGTFQLLLRQYAKEKRGRKIYQINMRTSAVPGTVPVPAGQWAAYTRTSGNLKVEDLTSAKMYDYQIAAIGGNNTRLDVQKPLNFTSIQSIVIT